MLMIVKWQWNIAPIVRSSNRCKPKPLNSVFTAINIHQKLHLNPLLSRALALLTNGLQPKILATSLARQPIPAFHTLPYPVLSLNQVQLVGNKEGHVLHVLSLLPTTGHDVPSFWGADDNVALEQVKRRARAEQVTSWTLTIIASILFLTLLTPRMFKYLNIIWKLNPNR